MSRRKLLVILAAGAAVLAAGILGAYFLTRTSPEPASSSLTLAGVFPRTGYNTASVGDLTVQGSGFGLDTRVSLRRSGHDDIAGAGFALIDSMTLQGGSFPLTGVAAGTWDVVVSGPAGASATCGGCFEVLMPGAAPELASVAPRDAFAQGTESLELTLTGAQFLPDTAVAISGAGVAVRSVAFASSTLIRVDVRVGADAPTGARNVTVTNPDGQRTTCEGCFTVAAGPPTISSINPAHAGAGLRDIAIEVTGTRFVQGTRLDLGPGITATATLLSPTLLRASVSVATTATSGTRAVTVINPDAQRAVCAGCFTVDGAPTVAQADPSQLLPNGASSTILVAGSGFVPDSVLTVSGPGVTVGATQFVSPASLRAEVRVATTSAGGAAVLTVTNPDGTVGRCENCLTVGFPAPTIANSTPESLMQGQSDRSLTITGSGFRQGLTASFADDALAVDAVTFVNATTLVLNVDVPTSTAPGFQALTVRNPDGKAGVCARCVSVTAAPSPPAVP